MADETLQRMESERTRLKRCPLPSIPEDETYSQPIQPNANQSPRERNAASIRADVPTSLSPAVICHEDSVDVQLRRRWVTWLRHKNRRLFLHMSDQLTSAYWADWERRGRPWYHAFYNGMTCIDGILRRFEYVGARGAKYGSGTSYDESSADFIIFQRV